MHNEWTLVFNRALGIARSVIHDQHELDTSSWGGCVWEHTGDALRDFMPVARALLAAESKIEALSETINVEREARSRRELALAREAWQAALGPELQSDEEAFRRWYAEAIDLTIAPVPEDRATGGGRWRG